jgi:hypothetical protein
LIPRSFHDGGALNYSTAPHRSKTTLISNGVFCLLESKILSIGQTLLYSLAWTNFPHFMGIFFPSKTSSDNLIYRPSWLCFEMNLAIVRLINNYFGTKNVRVLWEF